MDRRQFLTAAGAGTLGAGVAGCSGVGIPVERRQVVADEGADSPSGPALFIPGYRVEDARVGGLPAAHHPTVGRNLPGGYDGPVTLLTRLSLDAATTQAAVFPVQGHVVSVSADGRTGILHAQSHGHMVSFDPATLDLDRVSGNFDDDFVGGGHTVFLADGSAFLAAERAPYGPLVGSPQRHYGRITVRDPRTLQVLERYSSHGIAPHDLRLLDGGDVLLVANYGSTRPASWSDDLESVRIVEPSVALIDTRNGQLLEKIVGSPGVTETRHAAAAPDGTIAVVQVRTGSASELAALGSPGTILAERDRTLFDDNQMLPAPLLVLSGGTKHEVMADPPRAMRQGLSIVYDETGHQFLVSHPSAHAIVALDAASGAISRVIDTRTWGLAYPCGLSLHPDGLSYLVAGAFADVLTLSRTDHAPVADRCYRLAGFQHSHIAVA